jgi:hypothetical protein
MWILSSKNPHSVYFVSLYLGSHVNITNLLLSTTFYFLLLVSFSCGRCGILGRAGEPFYKKVMKQNTNIKGVTNFV